MLEGSPMKALLYVTLAGVASCTFPTVTYSDGTDTEPDSGITGTGGGGTEPDGGCPDLGGCEFTAEGCASVAKQTDMMCWQRCAGNTQCEGWCHDNLNASRQSCASTCEMCASSGCGDVTAACQLYAGVGAPY